MSRIRTNIITNRMVDGAPVVSTGLRVTGFTTSTNVSVAQSVTATNFYGDGSNLSGLASREVYGFTGIGKSLSLTTTNSGADNIDNATYVALVILSAPLFVVVNDKLFPIPVNPYTSRLANPDKLEPSPLKDVAVQTPVTRKPVEATGAPSAD